MRKPVSIVVALDDRNGIGRDNKIPWNLKNDLKFFRYVTAKVDDPKKQNALIVGRKTYETFPKALPNRLNIVVSRNPSLGNVEHPNVKLVHSFDEALKHAENDENIEKIFVIGGVSIYEEAMKTGRVDQLFVTRVQGDFQCTAVWSSFNTDLFDQIKIIPQDFQAFFQDPSDDSTPKNDLQIFQRKLSF